MPQHLVNFVVHVSRSGLKSDMIGIDDDWNWKHVTAKFLLFNLADYPPDEAIYRTSAGSK